MKEEDMLGKSSGRAWDRSLLHSGKAGALGGGEAVVCEHECVIFQKPPNF